MQKDKDLQSQFANYGAVPSDNVWIGIENALDKKKRKPLFWWWIVGVIGLAGFSYATITSSFSTKARDVISVVKSPQLKSSTYTQFNVTCSDTPPEREVTEGISREKLFNIPSYSLLPENSKVKTSHFNKNKQGISDPKVSTRNNHTNGKRTGFGSFQISKLDFLKPFLFGFDMPTPSPFSTQDLRETKWRFGFQYGAFTGEENTISTLSSQELDSNAILFQGVESITSNIRHFIPLQLSLQAEYVKSKRISFLFGVGYSRFAQAITSAEQTQEIKTFRTHTFDIPIQMNYNFLSRKRFQLYFGAGATSSVHLPIQTTENSSTSSLTFLGRISGAFGTRIDLTENIALNFQPTCQYRFLDTSGLIGERQFMFGGTAGIFFTPAILK